MFLPSLHVLRKKQCFITAPLLIILVHLSAEQQGRGRCAIPELYFQMHILKTVFVINAK